MIVSPPRETFRQTYVARAVITILAFSVAILLYFFGESTHETLFWYIAAAIVVLDVVIWILIGKTEVTIHDEGVRRVSAFGVKEIEWTNVQEYRYRAVVEENAAAHVGGVIGMIVFAMLKTSGKSGAQNLYLQLISKDGAKIWVTSSFKDGNDAIDTIIKKVHERLRPQIANEISATGAVFGPLRLNVRELQWKSKDPVPLRELASAQLAGPNLVVKQTGKFLSLVSVRSDKVPNVLLFLEEMENLGVAGLRTDALGPLFRR